MKGKKEGNKGEILASVLVVAILLISGMSVLMSGNAMQVNGSGKAMPNEASSVTGPMGPEPVKNPVKQNTKENGVSTEHGDNNILRENSEWLKGDRLNRETMGLHKNMVVPDNPNSCSLHNPYMENRYNKYNVISGSSALQSPVTASRITGGSDSTRSAEPGPSPSDSGGPDNWGYTWINSTGSPSVNYSWIEINSTGTDSGVTGDDNSGSATIGFNFSFYENIYSTVYFSTNGLLSFGSGSTDFSNDPIPSTNSPNNIICPFWDDLYDNGGTIYYQLIGTEPHRQFIVEWDDWWTRSGYGPMKFEAILNETGEIWMQYASMGNANSSSATVGIENSDGTDGLQYLYNSQGITDELAIEFIYIPPPYRVLLNPEAQSLISNAGDAVWYNLTIRNWGANNDTYNLTVSSNTWPTTIYDSTGTNTISQISLNSRESANITVKVDIPATANPGDYDIANITAASQNDTNTSDTSTTITQVLAPILVVDDDSGLETENWYYSALDDNSYKYNFWDVVNWGSPNLNALQLHNVTIWFTGNDDGWQDYTLTATDRQNLGNYLDSGGRLYFSSSLAGIDAYWENYWSDWYETYLHAHFVGYNYGSYTFNGISYEPIGDGMTLQTGTGDVDGNLWGYHGRNNPINDGIVSFNYSGNSEAGLIRANTGTYRVAYSSFDFAYVNNSSTRDQLMYRIIHWLTSPYDMVLNPYGTSSFGNASTTVEYTLSIKNLGNLSDTYNLSVSDNTWTTTLYDAGGTTQITQISLNSGESANITVKVDIPAGANPGDYDGATIVAVSQNDTLIMGASRITTQVPAPILVVDDDSGLETENWYYSALDDNSYKYNFWDVVNWGSPNLNALQLHNVTIWFTGNDDGWRGYTLTATDRQNLGNYLDNGGRLYFSSGAAAVDAYWANGWSDWYEAYLHAQFIGEHWWGSYTFNGIAYEPIGDGMTLQTGTGDVDGNLWGYHGRNNPINDGIVSFNYSGNSEAGLIRANTGTYRVAYSSFDFAYVNNSSTRDQLMYRIIHWLTSPYDMALQPHRAFDFGNASTTVEYTLSIKNLGNLSDTYNLSVSDNIWTTTLYDASGTTQITQISLNSGESTNITVKVDIPAGANPGDYDGATILATSQNDTLIMGASRITTQVLAPILVVDDDSGLHTENWYYSALNDDNYSYNFWDVVNWGSPDLNALEMHNVTIWFTGNDYGGNGKTLTAEDRENIQSYLSNGGRIYLSGSLVEYDAYNWNGWSSWFERWFSTHAVNPGSYGNGWARFSDYPQTIYGYANDSIGDNLTLEPHTGDYDTEMWGYFFVNSPIGNGTSSFYYDPGLSDGSDGAIIRANNSIYRTVYSAFDFSEVNDSATRDLLMYRIIEWLSQIVPPAVIEESPSNGSSGVPASQDVQVVFSKEMNTTVIPDLIQTNGTDPGGWTFLGWNSTYKDNDTAAWSHNDWSYSDNVKLNVSNYTDVTGVTGSPYSWNFTIASGPTSTATGPVNSAPSNVSNITITYTNESGVTFVHLYYTADNGSTWNLIGNDTTIDGSYAWAIPADGAYGWTAVSDGDSAPAGGDPPEAGYYTYDGTAPSVTSTTPADSATDVPTNQNVVVVFNESMNSSVTPSLTQTSGTSVTYTFAGWSTTNVDNDTATWTHTAWANNETISLNVSGGQDLAGNIQTAYSWNFTTATPHVATATGPTNTAPSNVAAINITYTYDSGTTSVSLYYTADNGSTWNLIGNDTTIDGSYGWTIPADGTYGWTAVGDGESAPSSGDAPEASSYTYDGTAPTVTSTNPADNSTGVSVSQPVVISFSEPINTTTSAFTCEPDPGGWSSSWNSTNEQVTLTHASFALNTTYWINITSANDTAGNTLAGAPYSFNFTTESADTTPPTVVSASPTGTGVSLSSVITITFNESMNTSNVENAFSINPSTSGTFSWNSANTTMTFTPSSDLSSGTTYTVRINGSIATDVNNNTLDGNGNGTSEGSPTDDYSWAFTTEVPDTGPPNSSISAISPYWQSSSVTLTLNASDDKALSNITLYYRFSTDNSTWSAWTQYGSPISISGTSWTGTMTFTFPDGDGQYEFYTIATDAANNTETKSTADAIAGYDSVKPSVTIDSPADGDMIATSRVSIAWTGSDQTSGIAHYEIQIDSRAWLNMGTNTSYDISLSDGTHTVTLKTMDRAGNENTTSVTFTTDTTPPEIRITLPSDGSLHGPTVTVTWHGSDATTGIDHYEVMLDSNLWINTGMNTSYLFHNLSDGNHSISVKAVDAAGNEAILSVNFTVDGTPPTVTQHSPTGSDVAVNTVITVAFSEAMNTSTVHMTVEGIAGSITWKNNNTVATFTLSHNLSYATRYIVHVTGSDLAGNPMDEYTWSFTTTDIGTITGTVTDENGNPVEGATVTLDTGETTTTDASGHFEIQAHAGNHNLTISKKGYETESTNARISPGQSSSTGEIELPKARNPAGNFPWLWLLIALLVIVIIIALVLKRRRPEEKEGPAEEYGSENAPEGAAQEAGTGENEDTEPEETHF